MNDDKYAIRKAIARAIDENAFEMILLGFLLLVLIVVVIAGVLGVLE